MRTVSNFLCVCILTRSHMVFLVGSAGSRRRSRGAVQQETEKSWSGAAADGEVVERCSSRWRSRGAVQQQTEKSWNDQSQYLGK